MAGSSPAMTSVDISTPDTRLRPRPAIRPPRLFDSITDASEYWVACRSLSSGGHSADPLAGDDGLRVRRGDRMRPSLRAKRSNPFFLYAARWIASLRSQ